MRKGLTPVLAFMLLTLLAVLMVGSVAAWMRETGEEAEEEVEQLSEGGDINFYISGAEKQNDHVNVNITNNGRFEIPSAELRGYFDGEQGEIEQIEGPNPIPPGETAEFRITAN